MVSVKSVCMNRIYPLLTHRYEQHYGLPLGRKKGSTKKEVWLLVLIAWSVTLLFVQDQEEDVTTKKHSPHVTKTLAARKATAKVDPHLEEQFLTGRLYGKVVIFVS